MECKCCKGTGVQQRIDGIRIRCPECLGTGQWQEPVVTYPYWYYYPYPRWEPPYPYPYVTAYGYTTSTATTEVK